MRENLSLCILVIYITCCVGLEALLDRNSRRYVERWGLMKSGSRKKVPKEQRHERNSKDGQG